jgi:hypothetical protein
MTTSKFARSFSWNTASGAILGGLAALALSASPSAATTVFDYTGAIVDYTVPTTGTYDITALGGNGGGVIAGADKGGLGAEVGGVFTLSAGEQLQILVGGGGGMDSFGGASGGGGGGGSFVIAPGNSLLVIAGGGGGAAYLGGSGDSSLVVSGGGGGGGARGFGVREYGGGGGGGGGFSGNGLEGSGSGLGLGGLSFTRGGAGGAGGFASKISDNPTPCEHPDCKGDLDPNGYGGNGGFGGGGGGGGIGGGASGGGGGGGGYTGGAGGDVDYVGAGGESYLPSGVTDLYASGTYNTGGNGADGDVDITFLAPETTASPGDPGSPPPGVGVGVPVPPGGGTTLPPGGGGTVPIGVGVSPPSAVPEPASWALMLSGVGLAGAALRRRHALKRSNVPV